MKKTRNIFVLNGLISDVLVVLKQLTFKGLITLEKASTQDVVTAFSNNKSIVCCTIPEPFASSSIAITVISEGKNVTSTENVIDISKDDIVATFLDIAEKYDCDIGDHKSNDSGTNGAQTVKNCVYCKELAAGTIPGGNIIYRNSNFYVIPTVGEFTCGYLLILPLKHVLSFAELSPDVREDFEEVLKDVLHILKLTYNTPDFLVWENGTGSSGFGKAKDSLVHAHMHVAPSQLTASKIEKISSFPFKSTTIDKLDKYGKHSYMLIKGIHENEWKIVSNSNVYIPRQYIRQLVAEEHGVPGEAWNWRTHPFYELITQTNTDIFKTLKANWNELPTRIKNNTENFILNFQS